MEIITEHRIRHLPVLDGEELLGIVSIGNLIS
jgi:CBS domain-containing protein